jgi:predicted Co/Zn/Cd cation transporter (cation efflux family)
MTATKETSMTPEELERQTKHQLDNLCAELAGTSSADHVARIGRRHYVALRREATIVDFIPLFVYRFTKDELMHSRRDELHDAA